MTSELLGPSDDSTIISLLMPNNVLNFNLSTYTGALFSDLFRDIIFYSGRLLTQMLLSYQTAENKCLWSVQP